MPLEATTGRLGGLEPAQHAQLEAGFHSEMLAVSQTLGKEEKSGTWPLPCQLGQQPKIALISSSRLQVEISGREHDFWI